MWKQLCLLIALPCAIRGATLQGSVVEGQTGRPLARTLITLSPVAGTAATPKSTRTNTYGIFEIEGLPAGSYLVTASRRAFATTQYGQKRWRSAGMPIALEEQQRMQIEIRLPRLGAIAGKVVDENDVGLPEHDVAVFRNTRPPVLLNHMATDDRGMYRFGGLEPGQYFVATSSKVYEDGGYLPTFHKDTTVVEQARQVEVRLDQQTDDINIRPVPGRLFQVSGITSVPNMPAEITLTLVSAMGSQSTSADKDGNFKFAPQAPGKYELNLTSPQAGRAFGPFAGYLAFDLENDRTDIRITGTLLPTVSVGVEDSKGGRVDAANLQVIARRVHLYGPGEQQVLRPDGSRIALTPGRWDFAFAPNPAYYPVSLAMRHQPTYRKVEGWNETQIASGEIASPITFTLSSSPGSVHGTVKHASQGVPGTPVFLEPFDLESEKRLAPARMTRTDARGQFRFAGLPPGQYRLLGTFEYQAVDAAAMDTSQTIMIRIEEGKDLQQDLDLYIAQ